MISGDVYFCGMLEYIITYYLAILPNVLTPLEMKRNDAFRAMLIPIEQNYRHTSCIQQICDTKRGLSLGKKHLYALKQLRV